MRSIVSLFPALMGILIVLQAGLNRRIFAIWGLPAAGFVNSAVLLLASSAFLLTALFKPGAFGPEFRTNIQTQSFALWFLLPGLFGFVLVNGGPWAVARWGATHTFI